jgi:hypothetical protein
MAEVVIAIEGMQFVLQTIGFMAAESAGIMQVGLSKFEDVGELVERISATWRKNFASVLWSKGVSFLVMKGQIS